MKLNIPSPQIERSDDLQEKLFGIKDLALVFEILRSKMYSNPIQSLVREYCSNARDSHIEAGKPDLPIEVILPNHIEAYWKVRDFGVGIAPERFDEVFINFGGSTKRQDDTQIGGFGCGSKTGFAYTDSFSVISRFNGRQRNYCCFIDETRIGTRALLSDTETDEPNGTEIIIPVKPTDFNLFIEATEKAVRHWEPKPNIKGGQISFQAPKKSVEGKNWFLSKSDRYHGNGVKLLIGEIEYPFDMHAFYSWGKDFSDTVHQLNGSLYLQFQIADGISLSASREQIYLDDPTKEKIKTKILEFKNDLKAKIKEKIEEQEDLYQANLFFHKELRDIFFDPYRFFEVGELTWRDIPLSHQNYVAAHCDVVRFSRHNRFGKVAKTLTHGTSRHLSFESNGALFLNDTGANHLTPRHVKKFFEENPEIKAIQIVCPDEKNTLDTLNEKIHLDQMNYALFSSISDGKIKKVGISKPKLQIFKFQGSKFFRSSQKEKENCEAERKVLCMLTKEERTDWRRIELQNGKMFDSANLLYLAKKIVPNAEFFGVDQNSPADRIKEEFAGFEKLDDFLDSILVGQKEKIIRARYCGRYAGQYGHDDFLIRIEKLREKLNPESPFLLRLETLLKLKETTNSFLTQMFEILQKETISEEEVQEFGENHPELDFEAANQRCKGKYPLLDYVSGYNYRSYMDDDKIDHIIDYVVLKDNQEIERKKKND